MSHNKAPSESPQVSQKNQYLAHFIDSSWTDRIKKVMIYHAMITHIWMKLWGHERNHMISFPFDPSCYNFLGYLFLKEELSICIYRPKEVVSTLTKQKVEQLLQVGIRIFQWNSSWAHLIDRIRHEIVLLIKPRLSLESKKQQIKLQ